jgi:hypothetical protein
VDATPIAAAVLGDTVGRVTFMTQLGPAQPSGFVVRSAAGRVQSTACSLLLPSLHAPRRRPVRTILHPVIRPATRIEKAPHIRVGAFRFPERGIVLEGDGPVRGNERHPPAGPGSKGTSAS